MGSQHSTSMFENRRKNLSCHHHGVCEKLIRAKLVCAYGKKVYRFFMWGRRKAHNFLHTWRKFTRRTNWESRELIEAKRTSRRQRHAAHNKSISSTLMICFSLRCFFLVRRFFFSSSLLRFSLCTLSFFGWTDVDFVLVFFCVFFLMSFPIFGAIQFRLCSADEVNEWQ